MKDNKIIVAVSPDTEQRNKLLHKIAVELGFALTPSDAAKLFKPSVYDYSLADSYFVLASLYNLRESPVTSQKLYELAARGIAVVVGVKKLPKEYELICKPYYINDI